MHQHCDEPDLDPGRLVGDCCNPFGLRADLLRHHRGVAVGRAAFQDGSRVCLPVRQGDQVGGGFVGFVS